MKSPICRLLQNARVWGVLYLILLCWSSAGFAQEPGQDLPCPSSQEIASELKQKLYQLIKLKTGLEDFLEGKGDLDIPLTALFLIDVNDEEKVAHRKVELQQELANNQQAIAVDDSFWACVFADSKLSASGKLAFDLQQDVARLRLQFFELPAEKRVAVLHPQIEASQQANNLNQLQQARLSAIAEKKESASALAQMEEQVLATESGPDAALIAQRAELERTRNDLAALQVKWLSGLEKQAAYYQDVSDKLAAIARYLIQPESDATLESQYAHSALIWRELVDITGKVVTDRHQVSIPSLPDYPKNLLKGPSSPTAEKYIAAYRELEAFRSDLQQKLRDRLQDSVDLHYRMLLRSGEVRSQLLNALLDQGNNTPLKISWDLLNDIKREIAIVPYRWTATFYLRWLEVKRRLQQGWEGVLDIMLDLALLLGFLMIPWAIWLISQRMSIQLTVLRVKLVRRSRTQPHAIKLALAIQKLQPYAPWLIMLAAVYLAEQLLALTMVSELALILPYVRYYIYYRLFRQVMLCDFIWLNSLIGFNAYADLKSRVDVAAKALGLTVLVVFSLLVAIESLIRRGLVYHCVSEVFIYLGIASAIGFSYQWRLVISAGLRKLLPAGVGDALAVACCSGWGWLLALPSICLLLLLLMLRLLKNWGGHFQLARRIGAEVFRYQLESAIEKKTISQEAPVSADYRKYFALAGIAASEQLMTPNASVLQQMQACLNDWQAGRMGTRSMAIVGHKGIGKTCVLDYLEQCTAVDRVFRVNLSEKLTTRKQILGLFSSALNSPLTSDANALHEADWVERKAVILVDDAHNLFLATQSGFDGFKTLLNLISQSPANVFWCLTFNHHAWSYLSSVNARREYFGMVIRLAHWAEPAIQALILSLHKSTGYTISYDDIIQAAGSQSYSEHVAYIETRFFNLLWQQSRGNPRLAVYLWLSALRQAGDKALRVGLPDEPDNSLLADLPDDALFVYASIARHENLNLPQLMATTQLPEAAIRYVLEMGVRLRLLHCNSDSVYRVSVLYQYPLIRYLQAKHCLYE